MIYVSFLTVINYRPGGLRSLRSHGPVDMGVTSCLACKKRQRLKGQYLAIPNAGNVTALITDIMTSLKFGKVSVRVVVS